MLQHSRMPPALRVGVVSLRAGVRHPAWQGASRFSGHSRGPSLLIVPVCSSQKYRHYIGNRHYPAHCRSRLFPSVPSDFTGTEAGNRHYSIGTAEGPLPLYVWRNCMPEFGFAVRLV